MVFPLPKWTDRYSHVSFSSDGSWPATAGFGSRVNFGSPCKLCARRRWPHRALAETNHCVSVGIHRGTGWNGHVVLRQDGHAHTERQSKVPWCETSEKRLLSFALLASEWTQNAKETMLFKSKQGVQADLDHHTSHVVALRCQDDRNHCCGLLSNHGEIKADVDARVFNEAFGV